jgi:hypothetical protein
MPRSDNMRIDPFLTGIASGYKNEDYVGDKIIPVIPVAEESGKIAAYGLEHYRVDFNARAMGTDTPRGDWQAGTPTSFSANEWSFEMAIDDRMRKLYQDPFDAERDAVTTLMEKIFLKREQLVASLLQTSGNFNTATSGTAWGTPATGTPVTDIRSAMRSIVARTGISRKNLIGVCSDVVWDKLIANDELKKLFLNTIPGAAAVTAMTPSLVASVIGLQDIIVGSAVNLTSKEGATNAMADVWSTSVFTVLRKAKKPTLMDPGFAAIFAPTVPGFGGSTVSSDKYREESKRSDIVRVGALYDMIVVTKDVAQIITGIS